MPPRLPLPLQRLAHRLRAALRGGLRAPGLLGSPPLALPDFARQHPDLHRVESPPAEEGRGLRSQLCRHATLASPTFRAWLRRLDEPWRAHRKLWELAYICQALEERGMLAPGRRGLGFAVGKEKLPALFASLGCEVVATDLPADDARRQPWAATGQWAGALEGLNEHGLCDAGAFAARVAFRPVDMNALPEDLTGFDFTWSSCSFEHCGDLALGLRFLEAQMACLRPGGVAVHTTEFNLSSNDATVERGSFVIYRLRDIEAVCARLRAQGHQVEPLDLWLGDDPADHVVDPPPYYGGGSGEAPDVKHLRLALAGHASTSLGLILRKGEAPCPPSSASPEALP